MTRPRYRNAQNSAMTYALDEAFSRSVNDGESRYRAGRRGEHFSAGHDIGTPGGTWTSRVDRGAVLWWDQDGKARVEARYPRGMEVDLGMCCRWRELPERTIAMVQGACIAGGLRPPGCDDLIIAADDKILRRPGGRMGIPGVEYFAHPWLPGPGSQGSAVHRGAVRRALRVSGRHGELGGAAR